MESRTGSSLGLWNLEHKETTPTCIEQRGYQWKKCVRTEGTLPSRTEGTQPSRTEGTLPSS